MRKPYRTTRRHLLQLGAVALASLTGACAPPRPVATPPSQIAAPTATAPSEPAAAPSPGPRGKLWVLQKRDFLPSLNAWFQEALKAFCAQRQWELQIAYLEDMGGTVFSDGVPAALAADISPDLVMHNLGVTSLHMRDVLAPVGHILERIEGAWGPASARSRDDAMREGEWWAVPYFQRSDGGWFQRAPFEEAGVDLQQVRTYPELAEACLAVSRPESPLYGWGMTLANCGDSAWLLQRVLHGWGAYLQDETGRIVTVDSPEMVAALTWLTDLYQNEAWKGMLPPDVARWNDNSNNAAFLEGKLAYTQNSGTIYARAVVDNAPIAGQMGYHPPCGGPENREFNSLSANTLMVLRGGQNRQQAEEAILHLVTEPAVMDGLLKAAPAFALPCYRDLWDQSQAAQQDRVTMEQRSVAMSDVVVVPGVYPGPDSPAIAQANAEGLVQEMVQSILRGTPVRDAVSACHARYLAIWKAQGLPGE